MNEIKLIDLQDIALPNWLPNNYIQAIADAIESTGFVPPIICLDDELLTPDVVAALVTIKARGKFVPQGVAVRDDRWLVSVDRRISKVSVKTKVVREYHYHDDWYRRVRPIPIWRDAYWTYSNSVAANNQSSRLMSWSAETPLLSSSIVSGTASAPHGVG